MKDNNEESKKLPWLEILIGIIVLIVAFFTPAMLGWLIPKENNIPNFTDSNDWIGFFGSYMGAIVGGIITLITVYITTNQTRKIQDQIINREDDIRLKKKRTIVEAIPIKSSWGLKEYRKMIYGNKLLQTDDYKKVNIITQDKKIDINTRTKLAGYEDYPFIIIRNVGDNPMCRVKILIECFVDDETKQKQEFKFGEYCINTKNSIICPIFKISDKNEVRDLCIEKITIIYNTDMIGKKEIVTFVDKYTMVENREIREISINSSCDSSPEDNWEEPFIEFSYILLDPNE